MHTLGAANRSAVADDDETVGGGARHPDSRAMMYEEEAVYSKQKVEKLTKLLDGLDTLAKVSRADVAHKDLVS